MCWSLIYSVLPWFRKSIIQHINSQLRRYILDLVKINYFTLMEFTCFKFTRMFPGVFRTVGIFSTFVGNERLRFLLDGYGDFRWPTVIRVGNFNRAKFHISILSKILLLCLFEILPGDVWCILQSGSPLIPKLKRLASAASLAMSGSFSILKTIFDLYFF